MSGVNSLVPSDPPPSPLSDSPDDPAIRMQQATTLLQSGQFGVAAYFYRQAAEAFDDQAGAGDAEIPGLAQYCHAMAEAAEGSDLARRGDRSKALDHLTYAINRLTQNVLPLFERIDQRDARSAFRVGVIVDLSGIKAGKYIAEMMDDIAKEDFDSALGTAVRVLKDLDQSKSQIEASDFPEPYRSQVGNSLSAAVLAIKGLEAYARAEKASAEQQWDKAATAFADAKQQLRDARDAYTSVAALASQAQIWQLFVDMVVDPARRRCRNLQRVWEDLERFKAGMVTLAHAVGETEVNNTNIVNNTQQTTATLKNKIDIQMTIVNEFEDHTRAALEDLRAAIEAAPIDDERRKAAIAELGRVIMPAPHDDSFFDRFKHFCADSAGIVGDIAKVAGPVATAWNVLAPFFGLPILPLPVK